MPRFEALTRASKKGIAGQALQQIKCMISRSAWNSLCHADFPGKFCCWVRGKNVCINKHSMVMAVVFGLALGGCSAVPLHSEVRQKQGEDAKKAWSEVDLKSTFTTERENLSKLLQAELQAQDSLALTVRNAELRMMLSPLKDPKGIKGLRKRMETRLVALIGSEQPDHDAIDKWRAAQIKVDGSVREQHLAREKLVTAGAPDVACKDFSAEAPIPKAWAAWAAQQPEQNAADGKVLLDDLREGCNKAASYVTNLKESLVPMRGRVGAALGELTTVRAEQLAAKNARTMVEAAVAENDNAIKQALGSFDTKTGAERVAAAALKLKNALVALAQAQDAFSKQLVAKERLDRLEKMLIDIAANSSSKPPEGSSKAVVAAILLPQIADDARAISAADRVPPTLPLIIMLDIERLRLEAATRQVKSLEAEEELSQAIVDALLAQALQIHQSLVFLKSSADDIADEPVLVAFEKANTADKKEAMYTAAANYLDAIGRLDARYYRLEYMRIAASNEGSLARSEVNAAQWESLINSVVNQAAAHSADGLKASDFEGLISALGIVWIGHGTNK